MKELFVTPFSIRKCVGYIFEIKQRVSTGKSSHWKTLVKKEAIQDFFVEQNGDLVMLKPSRETSNYYSYMFEDKKKLHVVLTTQRQSFG